MNKITVTLTVKIFSLDSAPSIIREAADIIARETEAGSLDKEDGDYVEWRTERERVTSIISQKEGSF